MPDRFPGNAGEREEEEEAYTEARTLYEFKMLRNPVTGTIPNNIHEIELAAASRIPEKAVMLSRSAAYRGANLNTYQNSGPNNIAGRSRTFEFDRRNTNIILSGGTQGGIFRSTDGGANWTFVSPVDDIRSVTSIAQDPTQPDTWYCGTGELWYPYSEADVANGTWGYGILKSTDNGLTWAKLPSTITNNNEHLFDSQFDLVHRVAVHPVTGDVYAAVQGSIVRSRDKGATWQTVLGSSVSINTTARRGVTEVLISSTGAKIYAGFTGDNPLRTIVGVWESSTGDANTWTRLAGGAQGSTDSVAGWQAYNNWGRVVLALNSTNTQLFALYKNSASADGATPRPEADLFRADVSSGSPATYTWTNLNSYVPDEPNFNFAGIDPYTTQFYGYNMCLAVKPDNNNILFIGGTVLERVDLSQTDASRKFRRIGGYGYGFIPNNFGEYPNHHPDVHLVKFVPGSTTTMLTASDGGIHRTQNPMADTVSWTPLVQGMQTVHFLHISISPEVGDNTIIGGSQDNGTLFNSSPFTSQQFTPAGGGDGASSAISNFTKTGNTWRQNFFTSTVQGSIYRLTLTYQYNPTTNNLTFVSNTFTDVTPTGLSGQGQFLTLLLNDPDSSEYLFYNSKNKLYRSITASTVTSSSWTELTGFGTTVPATENFTVMDVSKSINKSTKYLFVGTDNGHLYRLANPTIAAPSASPTNITPSTMSSGSYVSGIAVNPRNSDTVLAVVSNYDASGSTIRNIFWTGNATAASPTWQVIDGALEPLSVQSCEVVVKTTGVEYYVGTSVGLYSTLAIDGNNTAWVKEGSGMMKTAIIRSLRNRQRDNVMVVGTHGNGSFITTIGSPVNLDLVTAVTPVTNDSRFIASAYPSLTRSNVFYFTGTMFAIRKMQVELINAGGQVVLRKTTAYQNGSISLSGLAPGTYILQILSEDGKYRFVQKIVRQ